MKPFLNQEEVHRGGGGGGGGSALLKILTLMLVSFLGFEIWLWVIILGCLKTSLFWGFEKLILFFRAI